MCARHDYNLPPDYEKRVEEGTMCEWYTIERCKRQALRQDTKWSRMAIKNGKRLARRTDARSETVAVKR